MHGAPTIVHQSLMPVCSLNAAGLNRSEAPDSPRQYPAIFFSNNSDCGFGKRNDNYDLVRAATQGNLGRFWTV